MALTRAAKIESIEEQIAKLEQQKKTLIQAQKEQDNKDRTRRLIQRGAILESLIPDATALTNDQIKAFLEKTITGDYAKRQLASITAQSAPRR
jgi:multidrug resistance efflux pump